MNKFAPSNDPPFKADCSIKYNKGSYTLTINPDDKHQYYNAPDRLQSFRNFMYEQLQSLSTYGIQYTMYIELSEPQDNVKSEHGPRLHLHGIMKFCSKKAVRHFLMKEFYKMTRYAKIRIDPVDNAVEWLKYCTKQQHIMDTPPLSSSAQAESDSER